MGAVSSIGNAVENAVDTIDDIVVEPIENVVKDIDWTDIRDTAETAAVIAGNYFFPGSSLLTSQLVSEGAQENLSSDLGQIANFAAGVSGGMQGNTSNYGFSSSDPNAVGGVTGPDNIDVGGGFNPAGAAPITAESITQQIATPASEQVVAEQAANEASRIAAENAAYDQAMQDLAKGYVSPEFATSAAAQGLTFKQALDATRAGLLINAITGDPLGLSDVGGSAGNNFATQGFAQVPIPEDWTSPTYTYSPVQNVTFEDLFPGVSLQGTQWQNMPQAQTFNEMFASGQQQTPMGSPVDINQIVGSILGQSATS